MHAVIPSVMSVADGSTFGVVKWLKWLVGALLAVMSLGLLAALVEISKTWWLSILRESFGFVIAPIP